MWPQLNAFLGERLRHFLKHMLAVSAIARWGDFLVLEGGRTARVMTTLLVDLDSGELHAGLVGERDTIVVYTNRSRRENLPAPLLDWLARVTSAPGDRHVVLVDPTE